MLHAGWELAAGGSVYEGRAGLGWLGLHGSSWGGHSAGWGAVCQLVGQGGMC